MILNYLSLIKYASVQLPVRNSSFSNSLIVISEDVSAAKDRVEREPFEGFRE